MVKISVVIPIYNSREYLRESIESVIAQTYHDWEVLVINEFGSDDGSSDIIKEYSQQDPRIRLIQNEENLGLAESLNKGIRMAKGEYIARLDADDLAHPDRFRKQIEFMNSHPEVVVCGTYQHHFGVETDWVHKPAITPEQCKANLLFFCDLCHSTLMLRREAIVTNNLWYDKHFLAEDFELWTRVTRVGEIANIPEVLGEYRWGDGNITKEKINRLHEESGNIVAHNLEQNLKLKLDDNERAYFRNWHNPLDDFENKKMFLNKMERLLRGIYEKNITEQYYNQQELLNAIGTKWRWIKYNDPFNRVSYVRDIDYAFRKEFRIKIINRIYHFCINNRGIRVKLKKISNKIRNVLKS